jgi:hypothetical protein
VVGHIPRISWDELSHCFRGIYPESGYPYPLSSSKGLFGSVAIHWIAVDIHFFSGYPVFGLRDTKDRDSHFWLKMMVEPIPPNMLDEGNHFWFYVLPSPPKRNAHSPAHNLALPVSLSVY